jgi:protein SCO1/2
MNDPNYTHGSENDFIHTENVALIDTKGQIRGFYDGTSDKEINQLIEDIQLLLDQ